jgi:alpha-L-arabinofuranosidase
MEGYRWCLGEETANADKCLSINDQKINSRHYNSILCRLVKMEENEGFLVVFNYKDAKNYACWNVGGWRNTSNGIEICKDGATYTVSSSRGSVETGQWYRLKSGCKWRQHQVLPQWTTHQ